MADNSLSGDFFAGDYTHQIPINAAYATSLEKRDQMNPPYLILQKQSRILNISNPVVCVFDNIGSKCKIIYRFKISAEAGIQAQRNENVRDKFSDFNA
jgi:hypothetical protein